ncbi:MAG: hypothetical protein KBF10_07170, partial [Agathobacter sp.]|nr:hypothetical protein [Agathobacter sp.]
NCAVVPSYNANSVKVKLLLNQFKINIGAALQIFLEKENVPLLTSLREILYLKHQPANLACQENLHPLH